MRPGDRSSAEPVMPQKCQPPRNRITIRNAAVIMCRNSAIRNSSSFMPEYSV